MSNKNLHNAKTAKNDEFYTQLTDIEKEVGRYRNQFKGKTVFLNCDDPEESNFFKYFALNFTTFGIKKIIATHFEENKPSYVLIVDEDINNDGKIDPKDGKKIKLKENGDFRSPECIEFLKECDIVVTNPPFSLFREYVAQLMEYDKKFLIIGNMNAITYKEIFKLIKDNRLWLGYTHPKEFRIDIRTKSTQKFGNIDWFTNLNVKKRNEDLILYEKYNKKEYPKYDNYNAINVDKVKDIPVDHKGVMGVPITFLDKYNPKQFKIIQLDHWGPLGNLDNILKKKTLYRRIYIKNKKI